MEAYVDNYSGKDLSAAEQFQRLMEILQGFFPKFLTPTLVNAWVDFGGAYATAGFYKDPFDRVFLKGLIKNGTIVSGTILFTLPVGYRPRERHAFTVATFIGGVDAFGRIDVDSAGNVYIIVGGNGYISLSGISFAAQ